MSQTKVRRDEDVGDVSSEEEALQDEEMPEEEINIEFEGFSLSDHDADGIRQLLVQQFSGDQEISISKLTDALIAQNFVGTILKQSEMPSIEYGVGDNGSGVDDVFALVTCYSLTRAKDNLSTSFIQYLTNKCKGSNASASTKNEFQNILQTCSEDNKPENCATCVALLFNERYVNVPPQASVPMFNKLMDEISEAKKKSHRSRFDFTHFVLVAKTLGEVGQGSGEVIYQNGEEEIFADHSMLHFDYKVTSQGDDVVSRTRRALVLSSEGLEQAVKELRAQLS